MDMQCRKQDKYTGVSMRICMFICTYGYTHITIYIYIYIYIYIIRYDNIA